MRRHQYKTDYHPSPITDVCVCCVCVCVCGWIINASFWANQARRCTAQTVHTVNPEAIHSYGGVSQACLYFKDADSILSFHGDRFHMMTSSNRNIFRVTGHLCGKFTSHRTKASDAELWCYLWYAPKTNGWANNRDAGDLKRNHADYDVMVMKYLGYLKCNSLLLYS